MDIKVKIKNVYGCDVVYPADATGETFARIAGTKILTERTITLIKQLGYTLTVEGQTL